MSRTKNNFSKRNRKGGYDSKNNSNETKKVNSNNNDLPKNDPDWYIYDKTMFEGVVSMPKLEFKGSPIPWKISGYNSLVGDSNPTINTPDAIAYLMKPSACIQRNIAGRHAMSYSAVNVAARKMYAELSASNAKTSQYAPQDIATLILALGQLIAITEHCRRMYGVANYFNFYNRSVPKSIFYSLGMNYSYFMNGMSTNRSKLNAIISRINTIKFPGSFDYFKKCRYIYQNIFVDRDDQMLTYHFMSPASTWILDETSYEQGSMLLEQRIDDLDFSDILQILDMMTDRILTSSTFNFIFADIINLANRNVLSNDFITLDFVPIDYTITPLYSEQFNWQVMNMVIVGESANFTYGTKDSFTPRNNVYPNVDENIIRYNPYFTGNNDKVNCMTPNVPVRLPDVNVSDDQFIELLAYYNIPIAKLDQEDPTQSAWWFDSLTDYFCSGMSYAQSGTDSRVTFNSNINIYNVSNVFNTNIINQLVHSPLLGYLFYENSTPKFTICNRLGAFTQVDNNAVNNLRYQSFLGLFTNK